MFKVEDSKDGSLLHDKWFYGVSAKRYVIYDYDEKTKQFTIYKQSLHGLGHLQGIDQEK